MKTIQEYLDIMRDSSHYFNKSYLEKYDLEDMQILDSLWHCYEYDINKCHGIRNIFEEHSVFPQCRKMAEFITFILTKFKYKENDSILLMCNNIDELKNDYFNTIYINLENIEDNAQYQTNIDKTNLLDNKFDYITINIKYGLSKSKIYDKVEHELTHAYEDLQRHINNADSLYITSIKSKYNKLSHLDTDTNFIKDVKNLLYLLDRSEQNAYLAQFDGILGNQKYKNIQKAYNKIYDSKLYKNIKTFIYLIDSDNEEINHQLCKVYRKIYNSQKTDNKILKYIHKEWNRFYEHFRRNIYQCVCDHIEHTYYMDHGIGLGYEGETKFEQENKLKEKIKKEYINKSIFIEK